MERRKEMCSLKSNEPGAGIVLMKLDEIHRFLIMCVDKLLAKKEARRVPERTLLLIAAIGGSLGSLLGMLVAHHKTRKAKFYILVPLLLVLHAAAAGWYFLR